MKTRDEKPVQPDLSALYQRAEHFDCGFLLDFHCYNMFSHDRPDLLHPNQQYDLASTAHADIMISATSGAGSGSASQPKGFSDGEAFIEPLPISEVENGVAGAAARFLFRFWRENRGIVVPDSSLTRLSPLMLLTLAEAEPGDVPHVTFIGSQSNFRKYFPGAVEKDGVSSAGDCFPMAYRRAISEAHHWAFQGEPSFDIQRTGNMLGDSFPDMTLQRLLLRFETKCGFARLFSLVIPLKIHSRPFRSDRCDHDRWRRDGLSWHPAYQVSDIRPGAGIA